MSQRARLLVLGMMGRTPFAGVAWQVLQYLEGLRRLGHDVYYIEDTGDWPYDPGRIPDRIPLRRIRATPSLTSPD